MRELIKRIVKKFFSYMQKKEGNFDFHRKKFNHMVKIKNKQHREYLNEQLSATYWKKDRDGSERYEYLIDHLTKYIDISKSRVLCVGCRNIGEINYFKSKGACDVIGIDLFSENKEILVMDMHDMRFPDNSFHVILSSHSLEHSRNPQRVASEFVRVVRNGGLIAIEVPVNYQTSKVDLWDFKTLEDLIVLFKPYIKKIYLEEYEMKTEKKKYTPVDVIKIIFAIRKVTIHGEKVKEDV